MSNSNENTAKSNGVDEEPLKRLATFKSPRDLSLGGVKHNKKIFTPNLNVARNKNKHVPTTGRDRKDDKGKDRKNDRKKNNKYGPQVIKSGGVFSQGIGSAERQHSSRASYGRDTDSASTLQRPTIRVKDVYKIDKEFEEQRTKSVLGDGLEDEEFNEDFKSGNSFSTPVRLPMDIGGWLLKTAKPNVTPEIEVKQEPHDDDTLIDVKPVVDVKSEVYEESDVINLLRSDKPTVILLQLPKMLPGRGDYDEEELHRKSAEEPTSSTENDEEKIPENKCNLSQLEEGRIAKMRIHQSGRVTFALGDTVFDVNVGTKTAFYQELVSVAADDASRSASVISLGPLLHKLTIVPDWDALFADMAI